MPVFDAPKRPMATFKRLAPIVALVGLSGLALRSAGHGAEPEPISLNPASPGAAILGEYEVSFVGGPGSVAGLDLIPAGRRPGVPAAGSEAPPDQMLPECTLLLARSIHGGAAQAVDRTDAAHSFHRRYSNGLYDFVSFANGSLFYGVEARPKPILVLGPSAAVTLAAGPPPPARFLGVFAGDPRSAPNSRRTRLSIRPSPASAKAVQFRSRAVPNGAVRSLCTLTGSGFELIGDKVFWVRPRAEEAVNVEEDSGAERLTWTEVTSHSDLMLTSLTDGATRCVRNNVPRDANLNGSESGVSWTEPAPYPAPAVTYYAPAAGGPVVSLGAVANPRTFVECGGRIYWAEYGMPGERPCILMCARSDGAGLREVASGRDGHVLDAGALHAYGGAVYACITEAPTFTRHEVVRPQYLCRLYPDRAEPLEIIAELPPFATDCRFDGAYLYFRWIERRRSFWGRVTGDDVGIEVRQRFGRLPLPR